MIAPSWNFEARTLPPSGAIDRAKQLLDGQPIEVWEHGRFGGRLEPAGSETTGNGCGAKSSSWPPYS
jgi:hypothetical protein